MFFKINSTNVSTRILDRQLITDKKAYSLEEIKAVYFDISLGFVRTFLCIVIYLFLIGLESILGQNIGIYQASPFLLFGYYAATNGLTLYISLKIIINYEVKILTSSGAIISVLTSKNRKYTKLLVDQINQAIHFNN